MTRSPAAPKTRSWKKRRSARSASSADSTMRTPFPPARPSALSTTGKPYCLIARFASSADWQTVASAVGMLCLQKNSLEKTLDDSICAARRVGPKIGSSRLMNSSAMPSDKRELRAPRPSGRRGASRRAPRSRRCPSPRPEGSPPPRRCRDCPARRRSPRPRASVERPAKGVLAPASADHEDFHAPGIVSPSGLTNAAACASSTRRRACPDAARAPSESPGAIGETSRMSCRPGSEISVSSEP